MQSIGVTFGFIWMSSSLSAITIWQREILAKARQEQLKFLAALSADLGQPLLPPSLITAY